MLWIDDVLYAQVDTGVMVLATLYCCNQMYGRLCQFSTYTQPI